MTNYNLIHTLKERKNEKGGFPWRGLMKLVAILFLLGYAIALLSLMALVVTKLDVLVRQVQNATTLVESIDFNALQPVLMDVEYITHKTASALHEVDFHQLQRIANTTASLVLEVDPERLLQTLSSLGNSVHHLSEFLVTHADQLRSFIYAIENAVNRLIE